MKPSGTFVFWEIFNYKFNFTAVIGLFTLSVFLDSVLTGCMFLEICPFLLCYPISWHMTVGSIFLWFFKNLWYQLLFLFFHFLFCLFGYSLFPSWWAWINVYQFCLSFKKTKSWFHWSLMLSSVSLNLLFIPSSVFFNLSYWILHFWFFKKYFLVTC